MKIGTRPLAVATALLLLLGVVGLLVVDDEPGSTVLTTAASATEAKGTARISMAMSFGSGSADTTMNGDGLIDMAGQRARVTFTSAALPAPAEVLVDGPIVYVATSSAELKAQAGGKAWMAFDTSGTVPGLGGGAFSGAGDPMQSLRLMQQKGIAGQVRENGTQEVRGTATTRYVADIDMAAMTRALSSPQAAALEQLVRQADAEMEVWLDDAGVVRRSVFRTTFGAASQSLTTTVTTELFDFGVPVDIAPPPADQVHRIQQPTG
ncbi:MAG: hypothetical protein M3394_02280 [Actinomycetota bacterium]|nr:hypothetical protein [Actinomycetota bacterium]